MFGDEILLLDRHLSVEYEVRLSTRKGSKGQAYPVRDIFTNCVARLSDKELMLIQQRFTREWMRRETVAHAELEEAKANNDDEAGGESVPDEDHLEPMGLVDFADNEMAEATQNDQIVEEALGSLTPGKVRKISWTESVS